MPEAIVSRILRLPGYGVSTWTADEARSTLTLWVRQTARTPYYACGACGISVREVHSWRERRLRVRVSVQGEHPDRSNVNAQIGAR
jgi:hypothetical protein